MEETAIGGTEGGSPEVSEETEPGKEKPVQSRKRAALPVYIILAVIIIGQLIYTVYSFNCKKEGFFGDEIWSYGLANSYYKPFLFLREGVHVADTSIDSLVNYNEWLDGSVFKNYITVQPGERFAYDSVFSNQMLDYHPPFFYMILHTISSFFPNRFSFMYGFVINCVCLVLTTLFLFKLSALMTEDGVKALVPTALYAASSGALSTYIFIRQYSLLTALLMMTVYFTASFFYRLRREGECRLTAVIPIAVTSFLAFFTQYLGVVFVGAFTAVICLWLLFHKKIKEMLVYGGSELAALGLMFAIFPAAVRQLIIVSGNSTDGSGGIAENNDIILPYWENFRLCLSYTLRYSVGLKVSVLASNAPAYIFAVVFSLVLISIPLCFLFRNDKWFIVFRDNVKGVCGTVVGRVRHADALFVAMALGVLVSTLIMGRQTDFYYYAESAIRYVFHLMPFCCASVVFLAFKIVGLIPRVSKYAVIIVLALAAAALVRMYIMWPCKLFYSEAGGEAEVRRSLAGKNCLVILPEGLPVSIMCSYPSYLCEADKAYFTYISQLDSRLDEISGEQLDYILVFNLNYTFTEEQYAKIKALYEKYGTKFNESYFRHEETSDEIKTSFKSGKVVGSDTDDDVIIMGNESEKFYEMYPKKQFEPQYVVDVNMGICVVLERKAAETAK